MINEKFHENITSECFLGVWLDYFCCSLFGTLRDSQENIFISFLVKFHIDEEVINWKMCVFFLSLIHVNERNLNFLPNWKCLREIVFEQNC